jgi:hypothetical protein
MLKSVIALLATLASLQPLNAANIQARFEIAPDHVLPGLPALFAISLSNRDTVPHSVSNMIRLRLTSSAVDASLIHWGRERDDTSLPAADDEILLGAGETRTFYVSPTSLLVGNGAFWDNRLTVPGTYDLRAEIGDDFAIVTNSARLTVDQPSADDLNVWNRMKERSPAGWPIERWITDHDFVAEFPNSTYASATIVLRTPQSDLINVLPMAISKTRGELKDELRLLLIDQLLSAADASFDRNETKSRDVLLLKAAREAKQLSREGSTTFATSSAKQQVEEIAAIGLARRGAAASKDPYRPVLPLPPCKPRDNVLRFGYSNSNHWPIVIRVGPDNRFDPTPSDRQQPTIFAAGKHAESFEVSVLPHELLKWTLDGTTLTYQAAALKPCPAHGDD